MANQRPNVEPAIAARRALGPEKRQAVLDSLTALEVLRKEGNQAITKALVLKTANVSKSFLYSHPDLLTKVDAAIRSQTPPGLASANAKRYSDRSTTVLIGALQKRCEELEKKLVVSEMICTDYGAERKRLFGKIARLEDENLKLVNRLKQSG